MGPTLFHQHEIELAFRLPHRGRRAALQIERQEVTYHYLTDDREFPLQYSPPIPQISTLLSIINITVLFVYRLAELRKAMVLQPLSDEMQKKENLARYLISLLCCDKFAAWRAIQRPANLTQERREAPLYNFQNQKIVRRFKAANFWLAVTGINYPGHEMDELSSDPPGETDGNGVLRLRTVASTPQISPQGSTQSEPPLDTAQSSPPAMHGAETTQGFSTVASRALTPQEIAAAEAWTSDPEEPMTGEGRANSSDDAISCFSDLSFSEARPSSTHVSASTEGTSPNTSTEQPLDFKMEPTLENVPECPGCADNKEKLRVIEQDTIPKKRSEMQSAFKTRAVNVGVGRALEEIFFGEEPEEVYDLIEAELEALADQVDTLQSGFVDEADRQFHTC
jgi:hypothetical protein